VIPVAADQTAAQALIATGVPERRDLYLTPEEQAANDQFTPCCSRSRSGRVVLDLADDGRLLLNRHGG
jgi:vanillate O-demethylase ferredoxin subunit